MVAVLLTIAPGYIATVVWARARTWRGAPGDLKTMLQSLVLSGVVQLIAAPVTLAWLYPLRQQVADYPERVLAWLTLVTLVVPFLDGMLAGYVTDQLSGRPASEVTLGTSMRLTVLKTILVDGEVAGNVVSFEQGGQREVGYRIGKDHRGRGVATQASIREPRPDPRHERPGQAVRPTWPR